MKEQSLQRINQSGEGRFEVLYKELLEPFKKEVEDEYKELLKHAKKINNKNLKSRIQDLLAMVRKENQDMTEEELKEIKLRQQIMEENQGEIKQIQLPFSLEEKIMELMIEDNEERTVNDRMLPGIEFESIGTILREQQKLKEQRQIMTERVQQIATYWDNEIARTDNKIFQTNIRMVDISRFIVRSNNQAGKLIGTYEKDSILH